MFKKFISKYLPLDYLSGTTFYSQEGEDMILRSLFAGEKGYKGFFVDIGAHHPVRFSNTLYFYRRGWRGINVEPTPSAIKAFQLFRSRDINLNLGVGESKTSMKFYCFNEPALNSFSKEVSDRIVRESKKYKVIKEVDVEVLPLSEILENYLPKGTTIDFMSIDVEGLDYQVLCSNNWEKFKPTYILAEEHVGLHELGSSSIYQLLTSKGYVVVAKTPRTVVYQLQVI